VAALSFSPAEKKL